MRSTEQRYVYFAAVDPSALRNRECLVSPIFYTWRGVVRGRKIAITKSRPFAWLRRFKFAAEGQPTVGQLPEADVEFLRELGEFSRIQSEKLCEKRSVCGTEDAHLFAMRVAGITHSSWTPPPAFQRFTNKAYKWRPGGPASDVAGTVEECERRCESARSCVRYTYFKFSSDEKLSLLSQRCRLMDDTEQALLDDDRAESGERIGLQARAHRIDRKPNSEFWGTPYREFAGNSFEECSSACLDARQCEAVEYYKDRKDRRCRLFDRVPSTKPRGSVDIGIKRPS